MAAENNIELRNIKSLSGLHFYIPAYQRGYRWTATQATQMLEDFKEFADKKEKEELPPNQFYCLQPIVVKPAEWKSQKGKNVKGYVVIDGQQRLTTLYLLFKALGKNLLKNFELYTIEYATRLDSEYYLEDIDNNEDKALDFVDFFYMNMVFKTIKSWLESNSDYGFSFVDILLKEIIVKDNEGKERDKAHNVRIIWYELGNNEEPEDVFTRLNIGKIPLTNAELVKALLLRKGNFTESNNNIDSEKINLLNKEAEIMQMHISEEWANIEHRLEDNAFWYFIYNVNNPIKYDTRIEYLLDMMTGKDENQEDYYTFNQLYERVKATSYKKTWKEIKQYFQTLDYWYNDRKLYHLIGFLILFGDTKLIPDLVEKCHNKTKKEFLAYVNEKVKAYFKGIDLDGLNYNKDGDTIYKVLVLFNILTVLSSDRSDIKFPFDKLKNESWDKEHIASRTDQPFPKDNKKRGLWIKDMLFYFTGGEGDAKEKDDKLLSIIERLKNLSNFIENVTDSSYKFNELYNDVSAYFKEDKLPEEEKDGLGNMALLNSSINRSYKNAFFPIKRACIKENDRVGVFVPIATKNVFMKYYSHKVTELMTWSEDDAHSYLEEIKQTLNDYLS